MRPAYRAVLIIACALRPEIFIALNCAPVSVLNTDIVGARTSEENGPGAGCPSSFSRVPYIAAASRQVTSCWRISGTRVSARAPGRKVRLSPRARRRCRALGSPGISAASSGWSSPIMLGRLVFRCSDPGPQSRTRTDSCSRQTSAVAAPSGVFLENT